MPQVLHWRGVAWLLACILAVMMAATLLSTGPAEAETIHDSVSDPLEPNAVQVAYHESLSTGPTEAETIHDVVSETWPAPLVPTAEQIAYHESGGVANQGNCLFGMLPSTEAMLGIPYYATSDPYYCSAQAYRLYRMYGWAPWATYGWYTPGAGQTPITYW